MGTEILLLALVGYLVIAPDAVTLAATRGAVGGIGSALKTGMARRFETGSGSKSPRRPHPAEAQQLTSLGAPKLATEPSRPAEAQRSFFYSTRDTWLAGREAVRAARLRRTEGRDTFSRLRRASSSGFAGLQGAHKADGALQERIRSGIDVGKELWSNLSSTDQSPTDQQAPTALTLTDEEDQSASTTPPVPLPSTQPPPQTPSTNADGTTTNTKESENNMQTTELESLEAVRAEARQAVEMSESLTECVNSIREWATGLTDRWSGAEWGTQELDSAVTSVGESASALVGGEAMSEALTAIENAVKRAEALGDVANEIQARGGLDAFKSAA